MEDTIDKKSRLRSTILQLRDSLTPSHLRTVSDHISTSIIAYIEKNNISVVHAYLPIRSEVDIRPVLEYCLLNSIVVVCPKTLAQGQMKQYMLYDLNEIEEGLYGTCHPSSSIEYLGEYDLILVPAVAYDMSYYRLGYGGGYYDRFLIDHTEAIHAGVIFKEQYVDNVPRETHDCKMDILFMG